MARKPPWDGRWGPFLGLYLYISLAAGSTFPADKEALLEFKAGLQTDQGLLTTWSNTSDPCDNAWAFVSCNCTDTYPVLSPSDCTAAEVDPNSRRVLVLAISGVTRTHGRQLHGPISAAIANLTELRIVDLHDNALSGTLPASLADLGKLTQFVVNGNDLSGSIPPFIGNYPGVREAWLARNRFSGPLDASLCQSNGTGHSIYLQNNAGLCGAIPDCLVNRVPELEGTGLMDPQNASANPAGGLCDESPPSCLPEHGCRVLVPKYWTDLSTVSFSFTAFADSGTGIRGYEWGLGSEPNQTNVAAFRPFDGTVMNDVTMSIGGSTFPNLTVYTQNISFHYQMLVPGQYYNVVVRATNHGAQRLNATASSDSVEVDNSPPQIDPNGQVYNAPGCKVALAQTVTDQMWVCWSRFYDPQTPVVRYFYQIFELGGGPNGKDLPVTPPINVSLDATSAQATNLQLQYGDSYYIAVSAVNAAGLVGTVKSQAIIIQHESQNLSPGKVAGIIVSCVLGTGIAVAGLTIWITSRRSHKSRMQRKKLRLQNEQMKALMGGIMEHQGDGAQHSMDRLMHAHELAFVMTDMEGSTSQASANPAAFEKIQQVHDMVMREAIRIHNGYEINTEGDSFHIAFLDVVEAINFCMEVQYRLLLETPWSKAVLKLPFCKEVLSPDGELVFRGPRLRMAVHFAVEGTIAHRLHQLTKHRVFTGPGFQVAAELGEAANGGQVLMSHDAWLRLQGRMHEADFPVIEQLGSYKLNAWPVPLPVYQIKRLSLRPLPRTFGPLRKIELEQPGAGYLITCPPDFAGGKALTFVAMRLTLTHAQKERLLSQPQSSRRLGVGPPSSGKALSPLSAAPVTMRKLLDSSFICAQQFQGYVFDTDGEEGRALVAFESPLNAVRFCHVAQVALMFNRWPHDSAVLCGPEEYNVEGRLIFAGPRVAMALHTSHHFTHDINPAHNSCQQRIVFGGDAVALAEDLATCANGGQVVASEASWSVVQEQLPGSCQAISLGVHCVSDAFPEAMLLMEVLPSLLAARNFPHLATARMLEPGYRDSPDPSAVAIVFVMAAKPAVVATAESSAQEVDADMVDIMEAYNVALGCYVRLVRDTLALYGGYECKEPEPGKFTIAFPTLEKGVRWCAATQCALLDIQWPEALLKLPDCAPEMDSAASKLIFRGLRIRMGASFGGGLIRKPLNTGRADYFGTVSNLAARVAGLAAPGQILVEGMEAFRREKAWQRKNDAIALPPGPMSEVAKGIPGSSEGVVLEQIGYYLLKGLEDPKLIFQAVPVALSWRRFAPPSTGMRVHFLPRRARFAVTSSFASGTSGSGDSGNSSSGRMLPLKLRHLLNMHGHSVMKFGHLHRKARAKSQAELHGRTQSLAATEQSAPSELIIYRSPPSGLSPWGSFADNVFRRVRISGTALQGRSPFHFGSAHGRRSSRCSSEAELAIEEAGRDSLPSLPSYSARRQSSSGPCGDDVLVPVSLELASEDGSGMLASTPSGSIYLDPSSPSATARQHSAFARVRSRLEVGMDLERSASSCGPEEGARGSASGMLARMAVAKTGNSFGRSNSAVERPSPLSESSGATSSAVMQAASSAPIAGLHPDRWRTNPIADEGQAASSRSGSFSNQDAGRPELNAENAAYAREVAELFASSRRGIDRSTNSSFSSAGVRTPSGGSGHGHGHGHPPARAGAPGAHAVQEPNPRSSSGQKQQSRSSSTPVAIRREDVLAADPSAGPRSRSLALEAEAAAFPGRRRSITWRDRSGLATLPRSDEEPSDLVSRERSYPGGLPDVHEEMEMSEDQLGAHLNSRTGSLEE